MKILADTNVLISALLWPNSKPAVALLHAAQYHELVLCEHNLFEIREVINRKAPFALKDLEQFFIELTYILVVTPAVSQKLISDPKDQPILDAAIEANVDIIISGDKHFLKLKINKPLIMTAKNYLEYFQVTL